MKFLSSEFPVLIKCISKIVKFEDDHNNGDGWLPSDASGLVRKLLDLKYKFNNLAKSVAVPRKTPPSEFKPPAAECYLNLSTHTIDDVYAADGVKDSKEERSCSKNYPESPSITGGLCHLTCCHGITKGIFVMYMSNIRQD